MEGTAGRGTAGRRLARMASGLNRHSLARDTLPLVVRQPPFASQALSGLELMRVLQPCPSRRASIAFSQTRKATALLCRPL
jgi:hypothetical protein